MKIRIAAEKILYDVNSGLDESQIPDRRERDGRNELTPPARAPYWREFLAKFGDPTIRILLAAAAVSIAVAAVDRWGLDNPDAHFIDSIGIFLAVALATLVGFFSERKSAREFDLLNKIKDAISVKVIRNGELISISMGEVVVGDVVRLDSGDKIPADGVLAEAMGLYVDQAMLTGESIPVKKEGYWAKNGAEKSSGDSEATGMLEKNGDHVTDLETLVQKADMATDFFVARGTMVADGRGVMIVTAVGDQTQMGRIAQALAEEKKGETPLEAKLARLAKWISFVGLTTAALIFFVMVISALGKSPLMGTETDARNWMTLLENLLAAFIVAVTIIVVAVPEGLPMMVTVSLALNMMKMIRENCLVRKLVASETIGSATVICSDKTGTLTENRMTPVWFFVGSREYETKGFDALTETPEWDRLVRGIAVNSAANLHYENRKKGSESPLASPPNPLKNGEKTKNETESETGWMEKTTSDVFDTDVTGIGNPTECSLLKFLHGQRVDYRPIREGAERLFELSHNSERKMSAVLVRETNGEEVCYLKGAPERVIERCSTVRVDGRCEPISAYRSQIDAALLSASRRALRVLALCEKSFSGKDGDPSPAVCLGGFIDGESSCNEGGAQAGESLRTVKSLPENNAEKQRGEDCLQCGGHVFIGLVGISDPIRAEVPGAVAICVEAGVQVKMITGDALPTARAIAAEAGIYHDANGELAMTSEEFGRVTEADLPDVAGRIRVLARSTPMDKLRLVKALRAKGEVVAMTGDGTNDAPALKFADVGLSMGITGTEVAKEASDIVLVDDNFRSIVTGVWWGRTLFRNIQRFLQFQLSVNIVALLCALIGPLVGIPLPLTVIQLLWINIIMDTLAAIAYSTDPPRRSVMREKPIPRNAPIITGTMGISILTAGLYQTAILFATLFFGWFVDAEHRYDFSIPMTNPDYLRHNLQALTVFFTVLILFQAWHKINCRALRYDESPWMLLTKNLPFLWVVGGITAIQIMMIQTPFLGSLFRTTPLSLTQWLEMAAVTATILPVAWLGRQLARFSCRKE